MLKLANKAKTAVKMYAYKFLLQLEVMMYAYKIPSPICKDCILKEK